jgi:hypothetical protein
VLPNGSDKPDTLIAGFSLRPDNARRGRFVCSVAARPEPMSTGTYTYRWFAADMVNAVQEKDVPAVMDRLLDKMLDRFARDYEAAKRLRNALVPKLYGG